MTGGWQITKSYCGQHKLCNHLLRRVISHFNSLWYTYLSNNIFLSLDIYPPVGLAKNENKTLFCGQNLLQMELNTMYTLSQVEQHKSKQDCWFVINGRVLNVSKFLHEHPGGEEVLIEHAGKDATKAFVGIGHSKVAKNLLSTFQVGYLQGFDIKEIDDDQSHNQLPKVKEMEAFVIKDDTIPKRSIFLEFFVPLLVAGLYFGYRFMTGSVKFSTQAS